ATEDCGATFVDSAGEDICSFTAETVRMCPPWPDEKRPPAAGHNFPPAPEPAAGLILLGREVDRLDRPDLLLLELHARERRLEVGELPLQPQALARQDHLEALDLLLESLGALFERLVGACEHAVHRIREGRNPLLEQVPKAGDRLREEAA